MGACVSTCQNASTTKIQASFGPENKADNQFVIPSSPTKEKPPVINGDAAVKPRWPSFQSTAKFQDFGSKDETFFDSQAWLESDCEDDFMSVNGEFTPSRGNTPVHHNFSAGPIPRLSGGALVSPQPMQKKIRLSDLFRESRRVNHDLNEENAESATDKSTPEPTPTPGGETAPNGGGSNPKKERRALSSHSCFPSLLSSCRPVMPQQTERRRK